MQGFTTEKDTDMKFRYTILYVENVEKSLAFYEAAFGAKRGFLHEGGDFGELLTGETKLSFASKELIEQTGQGVGLADPSKAIFEIAFETDDVAEKYEHAIANGAKPVKEPTEMPWGQTVSYVSDIDGILVEICSPVANPG